MTQPDDTLLVEQIARALARSDGLPDEAPVMDYARNARDVLALPAITSLRAAEVEIARLKEALAKIDEWDAIQRTHKRRGLGDRFADLSGSTWSDFDEVKVPIRFGDVRALTLLLSAARTALEPQ